MHDENDNPYRPSQRNTGDPGHDTQLLRDLQIVNARTVAQWGALPPDGVPATPRRKPNLPHVTTPATPPPSQDSEDDPMKLHQIAAAVILPLAVTAGCSQSTDRLGITDVHVKQNPHPQERYELTFTVHDAPGPFDSASAEIQYEVWDTACVPTDPISGAKSKTPGLIVPIPLQRVSDTVYRGKVALDLPVPEDYFGLGVCHWMVQNAGIALVTHGVTFGTGIVASDIKDQTAVDTYFSKSSLSKERGYTDGGVDGRYAAPGVKSQPEKFFFVTIAPKRVSP